MSTPDDNAEALLRLADTLDRVAKQLRALAGHDAPLPKRRTKAALPTDGLTERLRVMERSVALNELQSLSQKQLGNIFSELGGSSGDKKRGKEWLVERILWYLFDFQAGHNIIKGNP